ncbi:MAG: hypothetical protein GY894_03270 [Planctomycetes bacterium]|nr:hypothetical protein [Planctomycetota bacterium]MCP4838371.1 hypothetical protein [Planctomycetota bacterium]
MGEVFPLLWGFGALVLISVVFYYTLQQAKKRTAALRELASELGLRFLEDDDPSHDERFADFGIFCRGTNRAAYNTLGGEATVGSCWQHVVMGDFKYTVETGSGKNRRRTTKRFSYVLVALPHEGAPELLLRREHLFDRVTDFFGFDDIDFESVEFSKRFHVASSNKRFAWDLIDPRMMEFLLAEESPVIDMEHDWVCIANDKVWRVEEFRARLDFVGRFLDHWPDHVVRGLGEGRYREQD